MFLLKGRKVVWKQSSRICERGFYKMNEARFIPEMHSRRMTDSGPKLRFRVTIRKSFNSEDNYKLHTGGTVCPEDLCP